MKRKKLLTFFGILSGAILPISIISAACSKNKKTDELNTNSSATGMKTSDSNMNEKESFNQKNIDLDFTKYGISKFNGKVKERVLLFPAQTDSNNLDRNGIFTMKLHLKPVEGVTGEWVAFATEVKSSSDNTLVQPLVIKMATTNAIEDPKADFKLIWKFDKEKLENGKSYTLIFWKKDGSEKIVFNPEHIKSNKDIFPARLPK